MANEMQLDSVGFTAPTQRQPAAVDNLRGDGLPASLPHGFTRFQIAASISPRVQELILLPTEKCNFRCTYCYEDFELGKMSEVIQRSIELFIEKRMDGLELLKFSWFGGEPLVAKDVVLRLSRFAKKTCDEHGVKFQGGFTTNAYVLDQALATELIALHQDFFQITLDGWKDAHDALRRRADGRGTFDVIWNNLKGMREIKSVFEVVVRVHVRRDNQENLETLMREYAKEFGGDRRFRLDFQHLRDMGGDGGQTVNDAITLGEMPDIEKRLLNIVLDETRRLNSSASISAFGNRQVPGPVTVPAEEHAVVLPKAANAGESAGGQRAGEQPVGAPYICYAAKPNSLLIRANGRIGKCTVALSDERNDVGYLKADGSIEIDSEKLSPWFAGIGALDPGRTGCPIQQIPKILKVVPVAAPVSVRKPSMPHLQS